MLPNTPVNSAVLQQLPVEHRSTSTLVTTGSHQQSQVEHPIAGDPATAADTHLPSKLAWLKWKWLKFLLLPSLLVMFGSVGLGSKLIESLPNRSAAKPLTQAVERKTVPTTIAANGTVKAYRSINLSPKTAGIIKTLLVKEGLSSENRVKCSDSYILP